MHVFFIHSTVDGDVGYFLGLAIVNNTAVIMGVYISHQYPVFFSSRYIPRCGLSYGRSIVNFLKNLHIVPLGLYQFTRSQTVYKGSLFTSASHLLLFVI